MTVINDGQIGQTLITNAQEALEYHKKWTSTVQKGIHPKLAYEFGEDLSEVFGPKSMRRSVSLLSQEEIDSKIKAVKNFTNKNFYVEKGRLVIHEFGIINLVDLQILKLKAFQQIVDPMTEQPVLYGLQFADYDLSVAFASGVLTSVDCIFINVEDIQRPIDFERQMNYYLGNYDSGSYTGIVGRVDTELNGIIANDGQQGSTLTLDHGVLTLGVNFGVRESTAEDARLLLLSNVYKDPMKPFEIYRNQVIVAQDDAINKGGEQYIHQADRASYYLDKIISEQKSKITFKFEGTKIGAGECNTVAQFQKLFKKYCNNDFSKRKPFQTAIRTVKHAFSGKPITSEAVWGLTELYKQLPDKMITDDLVHRMAQVLNKNFVNSNNVWRRTKDARDTNFPKDDVRNERFHGEDVRGALMASAIVNICNAYVDYERSLQGAKTVKDFGFPEIVDSDKRVVSIPLAHKTSEGKYHFVNEKTANTTSDIDEWIAA